MGIKPPCHEKLTVFCEKTVNFMPVWPRVAGKLWIPCNSCSGEHELHFPAGYGQNGLEAMALAVHSWCYYSLKVNSSGMYLGLTALYSGCY